MNVQGCVHNLVATIGDKHDKVITNLIQNNLNIITSTQVLSEGSYRQNVLRLVRKDKKSEHTHFRTDSKGQTNEIAQHMGYSAFSASDRWLQEWRKRRNITFNHISAEASNVTR